MTASTAIKPSRCVHACPSAAHALAKWHYHFLQFSSVSAHLKSFRLQCCYVPMCLVTISFSFLSSLIKFGIHCVLPTAQIAMVILSKIYLGIIFFAPFITGFNPVFNQSLAIKSLLSVCDSSLNNIWLCCLNRAFTGVSCHMVVNNMWFSCWFLLSRVPLTSSELDKTDDEYDICKMPP